MIDRMGVRELERWPRKMFLPGRGGGTCLACLCTLSLLQMVITNLVQVLGGDCPLFTALPCPPASYIHGHGGREGGNMEGGREDNQGRIHSLDCMCCYREKTMAHLIDCFMLQVNDSIVPTPEKTRLSMRERDKAKTNPLTKTLTSETQQRRGAWLLS